MVRAGRTCVLVDPLLCEELGDVHALAYRVYPPRVLRAELLPPVDAVILSHEHDDHFDIPSLARLDRRIPIFISVHSSIAASEILRRMGFVVQPLVPGVPLDIGDLQIIPFSGDHVSVNCADEWDALPYLIRDRRGAGSLFSMVDVALLPTHVAWAKAYAPRPGLVTWSNNALDWSHMADEAVRDVGTEQCLRNMATGHKLISTNWGKPAAMLICAGGFSFYGERTWLNERIFWVDTEAVCRKLGDTYRDERFFSASPGQTYSMEGNRLTKVDDSTPFLGVAPREEWPARSRRVGPHIPDYTPATGRYDLEEGDARRLQDSLNELAGALIGGILFRSLHSLLAVEAAGRKPTFALVLRHGREGTTEVFEYNASACAFVPGVAVDARNVYLAGWECWATDLLAVLRGEIGPIALMFGRARLWNAMPQRFRFDFLEGLTRVSHPLRRPADYLRMYERQWEKNKAVAPTIRAAAANAGAASVTVT
jgi:beta-lactamase family protein